MKVKDVKNWDFSRTGDGASQCFNCGAEFAPDDPDADCEAGQAISFSCPDCGGRSAQPEVIA